MAEIEVPIKFSVSTPIESEDDLTIEPIPSVFKTKKRQKN